MVMKKVSSSSSKEPDRGGGGGGGGGFKLFGVRIGGNGVESSVIRKSKSLDNLLTCKAEHGGINGADMSGYLSDGLVHQSSSRAHERKKGKPWTEEEHRSFLMGLEKLGKGDWKGIANNFVPTRNSSQVASHAQKYFIRKAAVEKKRRRASVFDIPLTETTTNQFSQALPGSPSAETSQPASKPAASVRTAGEVKGQASTPVPVTTCERPPLSPMKRPGVPNFHSMLYAPRGGSRFPSGFSTQAVVPTVSWVPVVNFPNPASVFLPSIHGAFATCATSVPQPSVVASRQGSSSHQSTAAPATKNDELNLNIRKLTL